MAPSGAAGGIDEAAQLLFKGDHPLYINIYMMYVYPVMTFTGELMSFDFEESHRSVSPVRESRLLDGGEYLYTDSLLSVTECLLLGMVRSEASGTGSVYTSSPETYAHAGMIPIAKDDFGMYLYLCVFYLYLYVCVYMLRTLHNCKRVRVVLSSETDIATTSSNSSASNKFGAVHSRLYTSTLCNSIYTCIPGYRLSSDVLGSQTDSFISDGMTCPLSISALYK